MHGATCRCVGTEITYAGYIDVRNLYICHVFFSLHIYDIIYMISYQLFWAILYQKNILFEKINKLNNI